MKQNKYKKRSIIYLAVEVLSEEEKELVKDNISVRIGAFGCYKKGVRIS